MIPFRDIKRVVILVSIVIFLGIGYIARLTLILEEIYSITSQLLLNTSSLEFCFKLTTRHQKINVVANVLLAFNAAFVALIYALLDTQFCQDMLRGIFNLCGKFHVPNSEENETSLTEA